MDFINSLTTPEQDKPEEPPKEVGILDRITSAIGGQKEEEPPKEVGFLDKIHGAIGGGPQSEKKEDGLDKAVDFVQEKVFGHGAQDNENAVEQAKDELISDYIRGGYKSVTGSEFPVADK